jgi:excinuclease ABC subunit A
VIKLCDHLIDIGPEGGMKGGQIVCTGTPEVVLNCPESHTAEFLKKELPL